MTTEMLKRVLDIRYAVPWPAGCGSPCAAIAAPQARITIRANSSIDSVPLLYGNEIMEIYKNSDFWRPSSPRSHSPLDQVTLADVRKFSIGRQLLLKIQHSS